METPEQRRARRHCLLKLLARSMAVSSATGLPPDIVRIADELNRDIEHRLREFAEADSV